MTTSAIGCRGWGSGRAGRIRTLRITTRRLPRPAIALDDRPPTALAELPPATPHRPWRAPTPPAEEKASLRREATSWDDGCSLTKSNANVRSLTERKNPSTQHQQLASRRAHARRTGNTGVRRGERCPSRLLVPDTRPTSVARLDRRGWGRLSDWQSFDLT
jgi:hypothetical protein